VSESKNAVRSMPRCQSFLYALAQTGLRNRTTAFWSNRVSVSGTILPNFLIFVVDFSSVGPLDEISVRSTLSEDGPVAIKNRCS
jgi:hypothetical protein